MAEAETDSGVKELGPVSVRVWTAHQDEANLRLREAAASIGANALRNVEYRREVEYIYATGHAVVVPADGQTTALEGSSADGRYQYVGAVQPRIAKPGPPPGVHPTRAAAVLALIAAFVCLFLCVSEGVVAFMGVAALAFAVVSLALFGVASRMAH